MVTMNEIQTDEKKNEKASHKKQIRMPASCTRRPPINGERTLINRFKPNNSPFALIKFSLVTIWGKMANSARWKNGDTMENRKVQIYRANSVTASK